MGIDFRAHDQHEHPVQPADGPLEFTPDTETARRIRDGLRSKQEAEAFAQAEKRLRGRG